MSRNHLELDQATAADAAVQADTPWADFGRCVGVDPDVFFPGRGQDPGRAKALCRECPVRAECLDWALTTHQKHGIWGGMTEGQRRRLGRPVSAQPAAPPVRHLYLVR